MKYTVLWMPSAERKLAEIWVAHPHRAREITRATDSADSVLSRTPEEAGESRLGPLRILFIEPLIVEYEVFPDDCRVEVLAVGLQTPQ